ncbi:MAG: hypothetical protein A3B37_01045 [Candidatus Sungbacteria bacterium RIFCSPLOWO2_01_FULL_59_16]|uniref:Sodium/calcium exchanger membrane region domain-containing protein n=1 Tax=Candidatus Sungbacteria bacterium RIFCSPLOWO2_01_FULL_59_16 TaxID=1802280 RepID=A0A1G2LC42_9BACT|nr:MAG: hypothetical protein A3B37_01045 [Candidatus Sungbacteria bacterium RIFCSPLOWO2_01_FULL_59_16]
MIFTLILFLVGFAILIKGASALVDGAVSVANIFRLSPMVVGLVIVGIGTSIPEFAVAFIGNLLGQADIVLGTVAGSNTFNLLFILGLSAAVSPLAFKSIWVGRDLLWNIGAVAVSAVLVFGAGSTGLDRGGGVILLLLFFLWLIFVLRIVNEAESEVPLARRVVAAPIALLFIAAGLAGVILGGRWVVEGAVQIAYTLGASEALVALTMLSIGTSLPELAVSVAAAWRREAGIAVGNIIGSNIFDFLMILGASAMVRPVFASPALIPDVAATALAAGLLFGAMFVGERYILKRWQGILFIALYLLYFAYLVIRG